MPEKYRIMADARCETDEAHYDIPWEFIHRTASFPAQNERSQSQSADSFSSKRVDTALCASSKHTNGGSDPRRHSRTRPVRVTASPNPSNGKAHRASCGSPTDKVVAQSSNAEVDRTRLKLNLDDLRERLNETGVTRRERYREEELVHYGVDRLEAERRLLNCRIGSFLVRMRDNGSLALSIRANKGILHIKLELRDNRWVLGEGPSFGSVATVVSFYRSHELPIRGAERMLLSSPLLVSPANSRPLV